MKNPILIILLFLIIGGFAFSQESTVDTCDLLTNKTWVMDGLTDKKASVYFNSTKKSMYMNDQLFASADYYLSNVITESFDETKIGNTSNGKYIVCRMNHPLKKLSIYEIVSISENKLEIRHIDHSHTLKYLSESE